MRKIVLMLAFAMVVQGGWSQTKNFIDQPYLETSARVDTLVTPDRIFLQIKLQESDTKGKTSLEELEKRMGTRLRGLGIDLEKQLTVSDLSSDFQKYFLRKQDILKEKVFESTRTFNKSVKRKSPRLEKRGLDQWCRGTESGSTFYA